MAAPLTARIVEVGNLDCWNDDPKKSGIALEFPGGGVVNLPASIPECRAAGAMLGETIAIRIMLDLSSKEPTP